MSLNNSINGYKKIATRFKNFRKEMVSIWEAFIAIDYYMDNIHQFIKDDKISTLELPNLPNNSKKQLTKKNTFGVISHIVDKKNPRNALIDSISCFEHFISFVVYTVYLDFPMLLKNNSGDESTGRQDKLIDIILDSDDKNQMIEKIVEEKVKGLLYGNPADFFIKDKAKLNFKNYFKDNHIDLIEKYIEINARRNIYIHNNGKVDSKYLHEVKNSQYKKGQIAKIDKEYLKLTINTLKGLGSIITVCVFKNIYKIDTVNHVIDKVYKRQKKLK